MKLPTLPALPRRKPGTGLAAVNMHRNVIRTRGGDLWAWYRIGPHSWSLRSLREREQMRRDQAHAWAGLVGHEVHLRITSVPFPRSRWAEGLDRNTPDRIAPAEGGLTWSEWLVAQQDRIASTRLSQPFRAVGVRLHTAMVEPLFEQWAEHNSDATHPLAKELRSLDRVMAAFTPRDDVALTAPEMWWLMHRSVGLGINPPASGFAGGDTWTAGHMGEFADPVDSHAVPLADTVTVSALRDGERVERHLAIRDLIRIDNGNRTTVTKRLSPWLAAVERFPFPVEVSARFQVIDGRDLSKTMEEKQQRAIYIGRHANESDRVEQLDVRQTVQHASDARQEVTHGTPDVATRLHGVIRLAVAADTPDVALERADEVARYYARKQGMQAIARKGQWSQYREFIPGESAVDLNRVDVERLPVAMWTTSWPGASAQVGDGVGPYTARTTGLGKRAVMVEPHYPIFRGGKGYTEKPANTVITGTLGSGKSYLTGFLAACAAFRGDMVVVYDPDGRLARLADVPELKNVTRVVNVTGGNLVPGLFNPWNMVAEPRGTDSEAEAARKDASVVRRQLAQEIVLSFIHPRMQAANRNIQTIVSSAVTAVGSKVGTSPWEVVRWLERHGHKDIALELRENINSQQGLLAFGEEHQDGDPVPISTHHGLTIITAQGLSLRLPPPTKKPTDWTPQEQLSVPIQALSQFFITGITHHADRDMRKHLFVDEVGVAAQSPSVVGHLQTTARTSRGNTTALYLISQDAADIKRLGVDNWLSRKWLGRASSIEDARIGLALPPRLADTAGYEETVLPNLSRNHPGEFVYADETGMQAEEVRVDAEWWPNVHQALRRERPQVEEVTWFAGEAA